ncbi:hypothetical protein YPPY11_2630, partial [Yersinia pestis PY-11]
MFWGESAVSGDRGEVVLPQATHPAAIGFTGSG